MAKVRTAAQAAAWLDRVGIALLLGKADVVLPSLWDAVNGGSQPARSIHAPDGSFVRWTEEMGVVWRLKDELPERRLACVGKHLGGSVGCIAPRVLPLLYALTDRAGTPADFRTELAGLELDLAEASLEHGPLSAPQLRAAVGATKKDADRIVVRLQRRLVLTNAGLVESDQGWPAVLLDLTARHWPLAELPAPDDARRALAELVLAAAGELTAADLAGALGWRRRTAADVLDEIAEGRDEDGFRIWSRV